MVIAVDIFQKRSYAGCGSSKKLRYRTLPPSSVFLYLQIGVLSFISHITHLLVLLTGLGRDRPDGNGGAGETRPATLVLEEKWGDKIDRQEDRMRHREWAGAMGSELMVPLLCGTLVT